MLTCLILAGSFITDAANAQAAQKPNIVLVMADDQGWGDMAYQGHPHLKTPNFDALAKEGVKFDHFYAAAPVCSPTRGSVMTGRTPNRFGCFQWGHSLRPQEVTLAQLLKRAGYRTGHFGKWHLGSVLKDGQVTPGKCGFDHWVSAPNFFDLDPILSDSGKAVPFQGDSSDVTAALALDFMKESIGKKEPFLAVVWFGSPHGPHNALEKDRQVYADQPAGLQHFYGEITAMDRAVGKLREGIQTMGIRDNTIFWYCSDNGALPKMGSTGGRRGFKGSIYDGGLLVPALLSWPGKIPQPKTIATPCVTTDILPTVLSLAGVTIPKDRPLDGTDLTPLLLGQAKGRTTPIGFWNHPTPGKGVPAKDWLEELYALQKKGEAVTDPKKLYTDAGEIKTQYPLDHYPGHSAWVEGWWKLHRIEDKKAGETKWELYDLANDRNEAKDLFKTEATRVAQMRPRMEAWLQSVVRSLNGEDYKK